MCINVNFYFRQSAKYVCLKGEDGEHSSNILDHSLQNSIHENKMSLCHMKKRYILQNGSVESGCDISPYLKHYETTYPPSPTMSISSYHEELQDFDGPWQQQLNGYMHTKRGSRTSSPQGQPVATMVSGFCNFF